MADKMHRRAAGDGFDEAHVLLQGVPAGLVAGGAALPARSGASTRRRGANRSMSALHCFDELVLACRQTTASPWPDSRTNGRLKCPGYAL